MSNVEHSDAQEMGRCGLGELKVVLLTILSTSLFPASTTPGNVDACWTGFCYLLLSMIGRRSAASLCCSQPSEGWMRCRD